MTPSSARDAQQPEEKLRVLSIGLIDFNAN